MTTEQRSSTLDYFIRNGLYLIPLFPIDKESGLCSCEKGVCCPSPGKHPLLRFNWKVIASNDQTKIKSWFLPSSRKKQATSTKTLPNVGVATGRKSKTSDLYLVCVDIDMSEHKLITKLKACPTFWYETGGGGFHFWYWSEIPVKNSVSLIEHKVDIRGTNGYVVVPPSNHISGKNYTLGCSLDQEIAVIPRFLLKQIQDSYRHKDQQKIIKEKKQHSLGEVPELTRHWAKTPVPVIREKMDNGETIPLGARNSTLHKLLSSDRARGETSRFRLRMLAVSYRNKFESPDTFSDLELDQVVNSCMSYPAYNNSYKNVNSAYVSWLKKRKFNKLPLESLVQRLDSLDAQFFGGLQQLPSQSVPLAHVTKLRECFFKDHGMTHFSVYRPQLLARKLEEYGFSRVRTNKGNLWKIGFEVQNTEVFCHNKDSTEVSSTMSDNDNHQQQENVPSSSPSPAPEVPKYVTNKKGEKFRVVVHKTKTKRKEHPNAHLYVMGRVNYDFNKAMTEKLATLDPEVNFDSLLNEELVQDREATRAFIDSTEIGDIIGVKFSLYKVISKDEDKGLYVEGEMVDGYPPLLTYGNLDFARWLGFLEIIQRDDKPYGVSEYEDYTVNVMIPVNEDGTDKYPAPTPTPPATQNSPPAAQNKRQRKGRSK